MKKSKIKEFKPVIYDTYEEAINYEIDNLSIFPIIKDRIIIGYRIWLEEDKNYLRDIISEELYWEGYSSKDFELIKKNFNYPSQIVNEICYGISIIEDYIKESLNLL